MTENVKNCIEQAERFLVLREHNKNELISKLKAKKYEQEVIDETIEFLTNNDELNESRYISAFIRSSNKKHPEGKVVVLKRLMSKHADKELSKTIANTIYTNDYTNELIKNAHERLKKRGKTDEMFQTRQEFFKLGFTSSEIQHYFETIE